MTNPNAKKSSTALRNTSSAPAAATRNGSATSSSAGGPTTDPSRPTTCGGGVGRHGRNVSESRLSMQREEFEELARPLIKWLNENWHPHVTVIVSPNDAELLEGQMGFQTAGHDARLMSNDLDFRRDGSRVDGGMMVATVAFAAVVFVIGVFVGWLM